MAFHGVEIELKCQADRFTFDLLNFKLDKIKLHCVQSENDFIGEKNAAMIMPSILSNCLSALKCQ